MRIISGALKGRRIHPPKNLPVRPTTDRAKEALFNILVHQYEIESSTVLDLFAGTGSISYEFASRGAGSITAVDQDARCVHFIHETAESLTIPITAIKTPVLRFLNQVSTPFHFVFADPPYAFSEAEYQTLIEMIFNQNVVALEGLCIIEHANQVDLSHLPYFQLSKNYGGCVFSFFER